jgi:hypothetical protein
MFCAPPMFTSLVAALNYIRFLPACADFAQRRGPPSHEKTGGRAQKYLNRLLTMRAANSA